MRTRPRDAGSGGGECRRRGYTLIELVVTIVILGLAGALVLPTVASAGTLRVHSAVRTVVSDLTFAQSDALAYQSRRAVLFDVPANSYSVLGVTGAELDPQTDVLYDPTRPGQKMVEDFSGQQFGDARLVSADFDGDEVLIFDELGEPVMTLDGDTPGAGGQVTISGSGSTFRISVEAFTGRISVERVDDP